MLDLFDDICTDILTIPDAPSQYEEEVSIHDNVMLDALVIGDQGT
jgi:hypothetical protein